MNLPSELATGTMLDSELRRDWQDSSEPAGRYHDSPNIAPSLRKRAHLIRSFSFSGFGSLEFDRVMECFSSPGRNSRLLSNALNAGRLSKIVLTRFEPTSHIINTLHNEQPNLREIVLHPTAYPNDQSLTFEELFEVVPKWRLLETFEYNCRRHHFDTPFNSIVKFLSKCSHLQHLVLLCPIIVGFEDLSSIAESRHHLPPLVTLKLSTFSWYQIQEKSGIHPALSLLLRQFPTLQSLSIHVQFSFERAETPPDQRWEYALANSKTLKKVEMLPDRIRQNMEGLQVQHSAAVNAISTSLAQSLTSIRLERAFPKTSDEAFIELFTQCVHLQDFSLHQSEISDSALEVLASVQESLQARLTHVGLRSLCLQSCRNISASPLARILFGCAGIVSLTIIDSSPVALELFTQPRAPTNITKLHPNGVLWACSNRLESLHLDMNAGRYRVEVTRNSDFADQHCGPRAVYSDVDDDSDDSYDEDMDLGPAYDQRIPDAYAVNEMALIRRQLDALVKLRVLRLEGVAMTYDLLLVPDLDGQLSHGSVSSSSSLSSCDERRSRSPAQSADDLDLSKPKKQQEKSKSLFRVIRPLTTGILCSVRILTNMYFPNHSGLYQRASHPTNHEISKEVNSVKEWWRMHAMALFEGGSIGTEYHPQYNKVVFRVYSQSELSNH
ncbi:hypothetical protein DFQ27_003535 [Actinomortierella ambigua]|uniref:Uncharacterized protein n=1 Tax=Actinomortierella ambigua TaxID=1343610 RepID=A0A9P6U5T7_9FUNG|nr:hypothetical protein DFQ27_003535 [Actinomortierella ambigua]